MLCTSVATDSELGEGLLGFGHFPQQFVPFILKLADAVFQGAALRGIALPGIA